MPTFNLYKDLTAEGLITNAGGIIDLDITEPYQSYQIDGTGVVLANDLDITTSGPAVKGTLFIIDYNGNGLDTNGQDFTIFGVTITTEQALGKFVVEAYYDGTAWVGQLLTSADESNNINGNSLVTASVTAPKLDTNLNQGTFIVPVSFEAGEVGAYNEIYFNHGIEINSLVLSVVTDIENTDDGFIDVKLNGTSLDGSPITVTGGDLQGATIFFTATGNNAVSAGGNLIALVSSKTTPGGRVIVSILYTKTI